MYKLLNSGVVINASVGLEHVAGFVLEYGDCFVIWARGMNPSCNCN